MNILFMYIQERRGKKKKEKKKSDTNLFNVYCKAFCLVTVYTDGN